MKRTERTKFKDRLILKVKTMSSTNTIQNVINEHKTYEIQFPNSGVNIIL